MTLLLACTLAAKAPVLDFDDQVKKRLDHNFLGRVETETGKAFRNEMGFLLRQLIENKKTQNDFLLEKISFYCTQDLISATKNLPKKNLHFAERGAEDLIGKIKRTPEDKSGNDNNQAIIAWIQTFYNTQNITDLPKLFLHDNNYFALQAAFALLDNGTLAIEKSQWAGKIFAISYFRSFYDLDKEATKKQIAEIILAFDITEQNINYNPKYLLIEIIPVDSE